MKKKYLVFVGIALGIGLVVGANYYREWFFNSQLEKNIKAEMLSHSYYNEMARPRFDDVLRCTLDKQIQFAQVQACPVTLQARVKCLQEKGIVEKINSDLKKCDELY